MISPLPPCPRCKTGRLMKDGECLHCINCGYEWEFRREKNLIYTNVRFGNQAFRLKIGEPTL